MSKQTLITDYYAPVNSRPQTNSQQTSAQQTASQTKITDYFKKK